jgi:hypothetical protein
MYHHQYCWISPILAASILTFSARVLITSVFTFCSYSLDSSSILFAIFLSTSGFSANMPVIAETVFSSSEEISTVGSFLCGIFDANFPPNSYLYSFLIYVFLRRVFGYLKCGSMLIKPENRAVNMIHARFELGFLFPACALAVCGVRRMLLDGY